MKDRVALAGLALIALWSASCQKSSIITEADAIEVYYASGGSISGRMGDKYFVSTKGRSEIEGDKQEESQISGFIIPKTTELDFKRALNTLLLKCDWEHLESIPASTEDTKYRSLCIISGTKRRVVFIHEYLSGKDRSFTEFLNDKRFVEFRHIVTEIKTLAEIYGIRETIRTPRAAFVEEQSQKRP